MSYQGLRVTDDGIYVRYRLRGELLELGPYATPAEALVAQSTVFKPALHDGKTKNSISKYRFDPNERG